MAWLLAGYTLQANAQANQTLSNLTSPTAVNVSLLPGNNNLEERITKLEAVMNMQQSSEKLSSASLEQNLPNPFSNKTIISYTLPEKFGAAQIVISDKNGKVLKQIRITGQGKGTINLDAATLASGTYHYSLVVDGKLVASKQMMLMR